MRCAWPWRAQQVLMMFERPHHQRIAQVLASLDAALLKKHQCLFAGGTVMALRFGEYRESVDIDFLVSNIQHYRDLRQALTGPSGLAAITLAGQPRLNQTREIRADQYGIRTMVTMGGQAIKFEIVLEGRIVLDAPKPKDKLCGIATLTLLDMATGKLLANSDRWSDGGVFNRDVIDLAMMQPRLPLLRAAIAKAEGAYGAAIQTDLLKAIDRLESRAGWLATCMQSMGMTCAPALVWQRVRNLRRGLG